ncbi:MAG: hypothetical protein LC624_11925 [Halobacteriales archaeon]|nr:hypothetical protein [Halobacteriales archaeon]
MHTQAPRIRIGLALMLSAFALLAVSAQAVPADLHAQGIDARAQVPDVPLAAPALPAADVADVRDATSLGLATPALPQLGVDQAASGLPLVSLGPGHRGTDRTQAAGAQDHPVLTTANAAPVAVVGGLAAVGAMALKIEPVRRAMLLLALPLYSRLKRSQLLDNAVRERIYRSVEREPGLSIIQVCRAGKVGWGTAVYHLQRMERDQMIVSRRDGQYRRFFLNGHAPTGQAPAARVLQAEVARRIAGFVAQHPGCAQRDVCAALGISPPLASKWLGRLGEAGLVTSEREWKLVHYAPTPALLAELAPPLAAGPAGAPAGALPA